MDIRGDLEESLLWTGPTKKKFSSIELSRNSLAARSFCLLVSLVVTKSGQVVA